MRGQDQQAYDRGTSMFSPDGRIYQVEYAREAVKRGAPSIGVRVDGGVVLAARTRSPSPLMETESIEKLHEVDEHLGAASAGHVADARKLVDHARQEAQINRLRYGEPVGVETLTKSITDFIQESTQMGGSRPFGAALLVGGVEAGTPRLFTADPTGTPQEWKAVAIGSGRDDIQAFLEEEYRSDLTVDDGATLAVRALLTTADDLDAGDLTPEAVAVAVVDESGYRALPADEVEAIVAEVGEAEDG